MELKVGKDKDVKGDETVSKIDVAKTKYNIRLYRRIANVMKDWYEEATTNEEKRDIGIDINSINAKIGSFREDLRTRALESAFNAQILESEISSARGELYKYSSIDQSEIDSVLSGFSGRYYDMYDARDDAMRRLRTAVGDDERNLQNEVDVLSAAILQVGIVTRNEMIKGLLPDVKGISSAEDIAEDSEAFAKEKLEEWFDEGNTKETLMETIKYGRPPSTRYEPIPGTDELEEIKEKRIVGLIDKNIEERTNEISSVDGVRSIVAGTDETRVKHISFSKGELETIANIKTPEKMVARINEMCTNNQKTEFLDTVWGIDDGEIVENAGIVCNVSSNEIHDAFNRMKELEGGVRGSGYEYMLLFLERMFKYGAFEDDVFDEMANYDVEIDLRNRIEKEILSCSCVITDTHEEEVRAAFSDRQAIERDSKGKGAVFMNRALRNIFTCDTFEDHVYRDMAEYEDPKLLIEKVNNELSNAGVYDKEVLKHAIAGINRRAVLSKETAKSQLDDVFGDHFTKQEYTDAVKNITSEDSLISDNRDALINRFRTISKDRKIRAGKILEGISDKEYNDRWDRERQKMEKHGETKNIETIISKRQAESAQKEFSNLVLGIDDESLVSIDEIRYIFENIGLQDHVINNLTSSITDINYVVDDNIQILSRGMRSLIDKHDMYEDDIFTERSLRNAVDLRMKKELGDSTIALDHMKRSISESVGRIDMTGYGDYIANALSKKIETYGDIDEESLLRMDEDDMDDITKQFSRRIQKYKDTVSDIIKDAEEAAIINMYAGSSEEEDVYVPPEFSVEEMQKEHKKEVGKARRKAIADAELVGIPNRLVPFISIEEISDYTDAIPKKPAKPKTEKGIKEMKWWESFMAKNEPLFERTNAFNREGLALVMRKGMDNKYVVYGEGGESVGFSNLAKLDKWFKANYGK